MRRPAPEYTTEDTLTRTLLAVVTVHNEKGRATLQDVAAAMGWSARSTAHRYVSQLRKAGLVESSGPGTLRPTVKIVASDVEWQ